MLLSPENLCVQPLLLEQRLRVPLVGIAGITSTRDLNFSTFQLTSQGDLFYQSFAPSSIEQDRTLAAGPGSKDLPVAPSCVKQWTQWAGEAQALEDVKWLSQLEQAKFLVPKKEDDFIVVNPEPVKKCKNWLCPVNEADTKCPPLSRRHFQMLFLWTKIYEFWLRFHWSVFVRGPISNIPSLVQIMAWHQSGNKPLSKAMMAQVTDAYMCHSASMC